MASKQYYTTVGGKDEENAIFVPRVTEGTLKAKVKSGQWRKATPAEVKALHSATAKLRGSTKPADKG